MSKIDISTEIRFRTARSGGKGGQNVNKVETMVEGLFDLSGSRLLDEKQKAILLHKLAGKLNSEGELSARCQEFRTQLQNKQGVIRKMNALLTRALQVQAKRVATKPSRASREKRLESKKISSSIKAGRQKIRFQPD
ncbi:aminoacyl-tRNA hydrolase [Flavihumibacter rivuli]|uniref:alternative ribosome rescue aminoacyl-tRNA hydrolase ArfB n=1 Tax=Flavihumibacter rivuli TaxID=2838156 RepID=UPI001BDE6670|nr:alternative ribosome rescue aminoacyl-tRNA hydrolase ArfB [Flavihumibacter rivuli]ULQ54991.1 aminoacyl-tRNA hydrolase [Flavihumibacter rivuli]